MRFRCAPLVLAVLSSSGTSVVAAAPESASNGAVELIPREDLFGNPERTLVQISPDGRYLSWLAPRDGVMNVWIAPAGDPTQAKAVTDDAARGIHRYFWTHRAGTLLYLRDTAGDEDFHVYAVDVATGAKRDLTPYAKTNAQVLGVSHRRPDAIVVALNDRDTKWHDLYAIELATGKRTLIRKNDHEIAEYYVDANYALRLVQKSRTDGGFDLLAPDGKDGWKPAGEIPYADTRSTTPGRYTTDGKTQYFADSRGRDTSALYAVDVATGGKTLLLEDRRADVGETLADPKTGVVQAVAINHQRKQWKPIGDAIAGDLRTLRSLGPGDVSIDARTLDDKTWIVGYSAAEAPGAYYRYDRDGKGAGKLTKLFSARPKLDGKPLAPMLAREIRSRDGLPLVSYLTLPRSADTDGDGKADKPVPLVLYVHGGPWFRDVYGYNEVHQWLANRGYAALSVNFRGSTGFGKAFVNAGDREWAGKMHDDLIDAVQWAVRHGYAKSDEVAIMGGSYGGYATLVGLTFTPDTFKCGVDFVGPSNLNTLLSTIPPYWASVFEQYTRRIGDPRTEEGRKLLAERSPLTRVDAIKKPLLIAQGANDPRVKQAESDQIVAAMKSKNIPVTYALFPDEGHGFQRPENTKAFVAVAEGFLAQCLGGRAQPIGSDFDGSSITVPVGADGVAGLADALGAHTREVKR